MTQQQDTKDLYSNPEDIIYAASKGGKVGSKFLKLKSLINLLLGNDKRWVGEKMPDNVKAERKDRRKQIKQLQEELFKD
jgi:hypothetical protein